ncbi:hypothetical protein D3C76_1381240 [compost metagenome]
MLRQLGVLNKPLIADVACERLFPSVDLLMPRKTDSMIKTLIADFTCVMLTFGVGPLMDR